MLFYQQTHKNTFKYHLVTVKPSFTVKMVDWMHQTGPIGRISERLGTGMSLTYCTITMYVTVSYSCFPTQISYKGGEISCESHVVSEI